MPVITTSASPLIPDPVAIETSDVTSTVDVTSFCDPALQLFANTALNDSPTGLNRAGFDEAVKKTLTYEKNPIPCESCPGVINPSSVNAIKPFFPRWTPVPLLLSSRKANGRSISQVHAGKPPHFGPPIGHDIHFQNGFCYPLADDSPPFSRSQPLPFKRCVAVITNSTAKFARPPHACKQPPRPPSCANRVPAPCGRWEPSQSMVRSHQCYPREKRQHSLCIRPTPSSVPTVTLPALLTPTAPATGCDRAHHLLPAQFGRENET